MNPHQNPQERSIKKFPPYFLLENLRGRHFPTFSDKIVTIDLGGNFAAVVFLPKIEGGVFGTFNNAFKTKASVKVAF